MPRDADTSRRLEVRDLTVAFGPNVIQHDLSFAIRPRSIFAIMGGSGCGKSTVLKAMIGLLAPATGTVLVDGADYWAAGEQRRVDIRRRFGVLFQSGALWSSMTVGENVALPLQMFTTLGAAAIGVLVDLKLALVGLAGTADKMPSELSGGMRKRAALARALALDPDILFFDEPSAGLDPITSNRLDDLILELSSGLGATVVIVTHELPSLFAICDDGIFLDAESRRAIARGSPRQLRDSCDDPTVRAFMERGHRATGSPGGITVMSARPAIVGAFILGAMGLAVAGILFFGGTRLFTRTLPAVAFFSESVAELEVGAPVTFHGVRIGAVKKVTVEYSTAATSARIPVVMEIQPEQITWEGGRRLTEDRTEFERLIRAGLRARLQMQSFVTGQLRIDLEFEPEVPARLTGASPDLPEIPTVPSELGQLWAELSKLRLHDLAESAQGAFASLDRVLRHVDSVLGPLVGNANDALVTARQTFRAGDDAIVRLKEEASTALRDLDVLLVEAHRQVGPRGAELSRTLNSADRAVRQAEALLASLNGATQPRSQLRGDLEAAIRDIATAAGSLRDFASTIERNPNALLLGRGRQ